MQTTANYGLKKPDGTDTVNIQDFNDNADVIDQKIKEVLDAAGAIGSHADTHRPGGSDPVSTAAPSGGLGTANAAGSSTSLARADHTHLAFDSTNPAANGTASAGLAATAARRDHVHPTDVTRAPLASPALTGTPTATTAAADTDTTQVATTAFVLGQAGTTAPTMDGAATVGISKRFARDDHKHPTDTTRAPLNSPVFTGTPTAPTAVTATNNTQIATTAFVKAAVAALVDSSPAALDTLNELAAALGDDPNFAATVTNLIETKADQAVVDAHLADDANPHETTASQVGAIPASEKGIANGIATLDEDGKVPLTLLNLSNVAILKTDRGYVERETIGVINDRPGIGFSYDGTYLYASRYSYNNRPTRTHKNTGVMESSSLASSMSGLKLGGTDAKIYAYLFSNSNIYKTTKSALLGLAGTTGLPVITAGSSIKACMPKDGVTVYAILSDLSLVSFDFSGLTKSTILDTLPFPMQGEFSIQDGCYYNNYLYVLANRLSAMSMIIKYNLSGVIVDYIQIDHRLLPGGLTTDGLDIYLGELYILTNISLNVLVVNRVVM